MDKIRSWLKPFRKKNLSILPPCLLGKHGIKSGSKIDERIQASFSTWVKILKQYDMLLMIDSHLF